MLDDLQSLVFGWANVRALVSAPVSHGWRSVAYLYPSPNRPLQFVGEGDSRDAAETALFERVREAAEASGDTSRSVFGMMPG